MEEVITRVSMNSGLGGGKEMEQNYYEDNAKYSAVNKQKAGLVKGTLRVSLKDLEKL